MAIFSDTPKAKPKAKPKGIPWFGRKQPKRGLQLTKPSKVWDNSGEPRWSSAHYCDVYQTNNYNIGQNFIIGKRKYTVGPKGNFLRTDKTAA